MNRKNFVVLGASLTGLMTVGVGLVALSGINQIVGHSLGVHATSRSIVINGSCIDSDSIFEDGGYYYFEVSTVTAVYNRPFLNDFTDSYFYCDSYRAGVDDYILELTCSGTYAYEEQLRCVFIFDCVAPITGISVQLDVDGVSTGFGLNSGSDTKYASIYEKEVDGVEKTAIMLSLASEYGERVIGWKNITISYNY